MRRFDFKSDSSTSQKLNGGAISNDDLSAPINATTLGTNLMAFAAAAASSDLYVSTTGSDSNNGSASAPFKTVSAASQHAQPGTTIHVAPGVYQGGFTTTTSGSATAHITYVSDQPRGATLVGGPLTNGADAGWWNKGDYVDVKGFVIDGSNAQAAVNWQYGFYSSGSHDTFQNGTVHDILRK